MGVLGASAAQKAPRYNQLTGPESLWFQCLQDLFGTLMVSMFEEVEVWTATSQRASWSSLGCKDRGCEIFQKCRNNPWDMPLIKSNIQNANTPFWRGENWYQGPSKPILQLHAKKYRHRALAPVKHFITLLGTEQAAGMHSSQPRACRRSGGRSSARQESSDVTSLGVSAGLPVEASFVLVPVLIVFVTNRFTAC